MVRMRTATEPLESGLRAMTRFFFHVRTPSGRQDSEGRTFLIWTRRGRSNRSRARAGRMVLTEARTLTELRSEFRRPMAARSARCNVPVGYAGTPPAHKSPNASHGRNPKQQARARNGGSPDPSRTIIVTRFPLTSGQGVAGELASASGLRYRQRRGRLAQSLRCQHLPSRRRSIKVVQSHFTFPSSPPHRPLSR